MAKEYDAERVHKEITVCDTHCDTIERVLSGADLGVRSDQGHIDIPRMIEGGVDVQVFACWSGKAGESDGYYVKRVLRMIDALYLQLDRHSDAVSLALTAGDVQQAKQSGKIAAILAVEGGLAIDNDLGLLRDFYRLGVRAMTLTWNDNTDWADASRDKPKHNGLTGFGQKLVEEMNRLGMAVDVSHAADKTVRDVLKVSNAPIMASHSCAKVICDHPRNLGDDLIKAIADAGGVICVNFFSVFLDQEFKDQSSKGLKPTPPPLSKVIDHIEHIVNVGGVDCAGIGSDFDGMNPGPKGLEDISKMPGITSALLARGYSVEDCTKIMGGNFLRVFGQVCGA